MPIPHQPTRTLAPDQVDIWLCQDETVDAATIERWREKLLSSEERSRGARFYFERDRKQFVITRAMVRTVLSHYLPLAPTAWQFNANQWGRPGIVQDVAQGFSFNLSHSGGVVMLAVSKLPVLGVDVENTARRPAPLDVARSYFSASEADAMYALPLEQQGARFFHYWTLKESYIKAKGKGLSIPLDKFSLQLSTPGQISIEFADGLEPEPEHWRFSLFESGIYTFSVCVQAATPAHINWLTFPPAADGQSAPAGLSATLLRQTA
ncbi:MAG: hypothetical protein RL748_2601 [Pseudomonadota bacterium]|jgi:4'-phosphopantetheinyl transferase